jgi:predicted AAA+ superfamily ATPase
MVSPRKVYPVDPALIPVFDRTGRANPGHALETCVLLELERHGSEIAYVRTEEGYEVDFLARYPGGHQELIQVCADLSDPTTCHREIRALQEAAKEHPKATLHLNGY